MEERAIDRLRKFARYARDKGVVKGENSFEAYCELSNRYIYNSIRNGKGAIGTDIIARIVDKFPELNVKWLCTGKGNMIETDIDANVNYKAYNMIIEYKNATIHKNLFRFPLIY